MRDGGLREVEMSLDFTDAQFAAPAAEQLDHGQPGFVPERLAQQGEGRET